MAKLTVKELLSMKGKRPLTQVNVHSVENVSACEAAGIDMIITWERSPIAEFRAAAPETFFTVGLVWGQYPNKNDALRQAFSLIEQGADAIYCPGRLEIVELLASEGIAVHGHVGFVPYKKTWTGGFRSVGKTADEAMQVWQRALDYQNAGAMAIEVELVPVPVAKAISQKLNILTVAMGAGNGCDAQYLFAKDILGSHDGHIPRHAKTYRNHKQKYDDLYADSIEAFSEFHSDVVKGFFPGEEHVLNIDEKHLEDFLTRLDGVDI